MRFLSEITYIVAAVLFILGLKRLSSPATARSGNLMGAIGMLLAVVATLIVEEIIGPWALVGGLVLGGAIGAAMAYMVRITAMPQMVAVLNGFGGGASALVAGAEYLRITETTAAFDVGIIALTVLVGGLTFSGSVIAWAKLQEVMTGRPITYPLQKTFNLGLLLLVVLLVVDLVVASMSDSTSVAANLLGE